MSTVSGAISWDAVQSRPQNTTLKTLLRLRTVLGQGAVSWKGSAECTCTYRGHCSLLAPIDGCRHVGWQSDFVARPSPVHWVVHPRLELRRGEMRELVEAHGERLKTLLKPSVVRRHHFLVRCKDFPCLLDFDNLCNESGRYQHRATVSEGPAFMREAARWA